MNKSFIKVFISVLVVVGSICIFELPSDWKVGKPSVDVVRIGNNGELAAILIRGAIIDSKLPFELISSKSLKGKSNKVIISLMGINNDFVRKYPRATILKATTAICQRLVEDGGIKSVRCIIMFPWQRGTKMVADMTFPIVAMKSLNVPTIESEGILGYATDVWIDPSII